MKKTVSIILLTSICLILSGCVFSIGGGSHKHKKSDPCPEYNNIESAFAEIRAVRRLISQSARLNVYKAIAKRPGLSSRARAFLADEASKHLISQSAREKVLLTLANNIPPRRKIIEADKVQNHSDTAIAEILAVRQLTTNSSRLNVYKAIAQRPNLSPKARAYLADESSKYLTTNSSREEVLLTLAKNTAYQQQIEVIVEEGKP